MAAVVVDSSCLIALKRINRLELIPAVFPGVIAPAAVLQEFGESPEWLPVHSVSDQALLAALLTQLDPGESEVLALALERGSSTVLLDEKKARRLAHQLGLRTVGTVGLLLLAKRAGHIPLIRPVMDALVGADFRISEALYTEAVRLAGEE